MAVLPICVILLLQILPFPAWFIGFITGILIAVPTSAYLTYWFFGGSDLPAPTPFVDNIQRKVAQRPAIIVQEELERKFIWMNLWPTKKGPYDPLTYDVRRTSTARIMLHGPWIEVRFPKRNLPFRRMYSDVEPKKVDFHDQVEVIDLSTCSIDLLPENLPSKRMWSKKYPIRIRTNTRKLTQPIKSAESINQSLINEAGNDQKQTSHVAVDRPEDAKNNQPKNMECIKSGLLCKESIADAGIEKHAFQHLLEEQCESSQVIKAAADSDVGPEENVDSDADDSNFRDAVDDTCSVEDVDSSFDEVKSKAKDDSDNLELSFSYLHSFDGYDIDKVSKGKENARDKATNVVEVGLRTDDKDALIPDGENFDSIAREDEGTAPSPGDNAPDDSTMKEDASNNKTFYFFARTGREKEEWYNRFLVAANFMQDWEHQNPKLGEKVDPNYETQKVKEQKFKIFMEDYSQAKDSDVAMKNHKETKESPELSQRAKDQAAFLNIYFARMWHDLHDNKVFIDYLREKITRKLLKVKFA